MRYKLQTAKRMGNMLYAVALTMRKVIHWVNTPFISGSVVMCKFNSIEQRISKVHVGIGHVYLGSQYLFSIFIFAFFHFFEEFEVLFYAARSVWTFCPRHCGCTFLFGYFFRSGIIHISQSFFY